MAKEQASVRRLPHAKGIFGPGTPPSVANDNRRDDELVDAFFEVPAAVLCATCGEPDCLGCQPATDLESGVVAIVPWERKGPTWTRLWATATAATQGAEAFFAVLPDGEIPPAIRFAVLAELLAVASMAVFLVPVAAVALPGVALAVVQNPGARLMALRAVGLGVPALALWMVAAHLTHGAALDVGARREGARPSRRRAVRFGLYACGWDLMSGPLGALAMLVTRGAREAAHAAQLAVQVRARAANVFLGAIYELPEARIHRARRVGSLGVVLLAALTALAIAALSLAMPG